MTSKEQYVQIMAMLFGPASAKVLESMTDEASAKHCRDKVEAFFGKDKAEEIFKELK